jgi:cytosine/adenosine deaminase-related metal-dependent hydrolase
VAGKRTRLRARHVIGFDGRGHVLWRNGEVVFADGRILFVGRGFEGRIDEDLDFGEAVIGPGFIDLDALGDIDSTVLAFDNGPEWRLGRIWTERYLAEGPREAYSPEEELFKYRYAFTQLILNGITTAMPITSMTYRAWAETYDEFAAVAGLAGEMGLRAYLGPCYMSGVTITDEQGNLLQHWDEPRGLKGLEEAQRFIRDFDGAHQGLVCAMLAPDRIETCTPALLAGTARVARETGVPVRLHCCQSRYEVELVKRLRGMSPYRWLADLGLLGPGAVLPHGIYLEPGDLGLLAGSGAAIVHCPVVFARDGEALDSFASYLGRGVTVALGTDTAPPDLLDNMRQGLNICRVVEGRAAASAADFYTAATLGGAKALGRDDIGRLAPGAQADITVFDLGGLHLGPVIDPVKTMVLAGTGRDFTHAWIAGRAVMADRVIPGVDGEDLRRRAQAQFERLAASHQARAPGRPPPEKLFTPSFPVAG